MIERGLAHSRPRARGPFSLGQLGRSILCAFHPQNKPSSHQSPAFGPTLYKFIVIIFSLTSYVGSQFSDRAHYNEFVESGAKILAVMRQRLVLGMKGT